MSKVYGIIAAITGELAKSGIAKSRRNTQQGFDYRGIDDVYNALAPLMSKHGLVIVPHVTDRTATERTTAKGGTLFHTVLTVTFDFIAAEDGSSVTVGPVLGEAMDSGDKATNKAMSVAYKYAAFQVFCIPLEAADPDADTHQVAPEFVTPEQAANIEALLTELGANRQMFLRYMKADDVETIRAAHYDNAIAALEKKRRAA